MGCAESRQELSSQSLRSALDDVELPEPPSPAMGSPPLQFPTASVQLSSQHERLILDLLPFKDIRQFYEYVVSPCSRQKRGMKLTT